MMITKQIQNIKVNICNNDIIEWGKLFYGMPDDAILVNKQQLETETMGFSSIDDKEIWIFRPKNYTLEDLLSTSAHELGHIIEGGYKKNPPQTKRYDKKHEDKANHYEDFALLAYEIAIEVYNEL